MYVKVPRGTIDPLFVKSVPCIYLLLLAVSLPDTCLNLYAVFM